MICIFTDKEKNKSMKKFYTNFLIITYLTGISAYSQYLVSHQLLASYTQQEAYDYLVSQGLPAALIPITNGLKSYKIVYNTVGWDSSATIASGVVFVPQGLTCKSPIMVYNHGTMLKRSQAPSNMGGEYLIGVATSADGMVVAMPDYLGLGESPGIHPYHHAHSEATCVIDMIRATRELSVVLDYGLNDQVFLTGYSQGGHVTMATHKLIESSFSSEFKIAASAPLSGAYQLSGVQAEVITRDSSYGAPGYLPFIINTFNTVYNLYPSYSDIYKSPYDVLIPPFFDGNYSIGQLENVIPDTPKAILLPSVLSDFENNPNNPFRLTLEENNLYNWSPIAPMRMYYCEADELVTYLNALEAKNTMHINGAVHVESVSANPAAGHQDCALYALLQTKFYFELYRNDRYTVQVQTYAASGAGIDDGMATAIPLGGYEPYTYNWSNGMQGETVNGLGSGQYSVIVTDANGCETTAYAGIGTIGLPTYTESMSWTAYPNPANEHLNLKFEHQIEKGMYVLTSMQGDVVHMQALTSISGEVRISVEGLSDGVYLLSVYADGKHGNLRIVVQH